MVFALLLDAQAQWAYAHAWPDSARRSRALASGPRRCRAVVAGARPSRGTRGSGIGLERAGNIEKIGVRTDANPESSAPRVWAAVGVRARV
jgi:hypothetical protein